MAASVGEDFMSDEIVINKCCVCEKKNKSTEAAKYCVECKAYFCKQCVDIHSVFPATEGHKLLDNSDFTSKRSGAGSLPSFPTQRCEVHKSDVLNMYCQDDDEVVCRTCISLNHLCTILHILTKCHLASFEKSCRHVFSISDNVNHLYKRSEYSRVEHNIKLTIAHIEHFKKTKEDHMKMLKISLKTALDSVKTFKQELQTLLDKIEQQTVTELKKEYDIMEKSLKEEIKEAEKQMDALNKMDAKLKHAVGNQSEEFVCVKTSEKLTKMNEGKNKQHNQPEETVTFVAEQSVKSYLQQLKVFGKTMSMKSVPETRLYKVSKQREINVRVRDDKYNCEICGSCITDDGVLLLVDFVNCKLKRMNLSTETVTDYLNLISSPNAVCQASKAEAAVSLNNKSVLFVTLGDKMKVTGTLSFNHLCQGLAYNSDKLFISDRSTAVYIYDMNGKQLRKITKHVSGKNIFRISKHIAVSADEKIAFVVDDDKGLITLSNQGNYLSTLSISDIQISSLWGVCTDDRNVYVCGNGTHNIVQLTMDSKVVAPIATVWSLDTTCYSICIDSRKSRLYVSKAGSDAIIVLERQ